MMLSRTGSQQFMESSRQTVSDQSVSVTETELASHYRSHCPWKLIAMTFGRAKTGMAAEVSCGHDIVDEVRWYMHFKFYKVV